MSLDDLLSGKEMEKVVERNPVIEKKSVNNIMIALYAFVVISFFITIVDIIIRFPLQSEMIDYNDIQAIVINVLALLIQIFSLRMVLLMLYEECYHQKDGCRNCCIFCCDLYYWKCGN